MKTPKLILFDFGHTIMTEPFDGVKGTAAVIKHAVSNKKLFSKYYTISQ